MLKMIRKSFLFKRLEMKTLSTGIVYTSRYLDHDTGPFHPESPTRLLGIAERLERNEIMGRPFGATIGPKIASIEEIELVQSPRYIRFVKECCEKGVQRLDSDMPICPAWMHRGPGHSVLGALSPSMPHNVRVTLAP